MIPFNIFGHTNVFTSQSEDPIVWVDAQDISTYTIGTASGLGNELVVNGEFDTDTDWSSNGNWIISGGTANYDALNSTRYIAQNITQMKKDVIYQVSFDIIGGDARLNFVGRDLDNNNSSTSIFENIGVNPNLNSSSYFFPSGNYNFNTKCLINTTLFRLFAYVGGSTGAGNGTDFSIDNVSVKEILAYEVTNLDNKGTLGGVMTLNGTVKFANSGFESWTASDYITKDLGEPFLTNNSFTTVTTFNLKDTATGDNNLYNWFVSMYDGFQNRFEDLRNGARTGYIVKASNVGLSNVDRTNFLGVQTLVSSYDITSNTLELLYSNGENSQHLSVVWNNTNDILLYLLRSTSITDANSGANNPLYEFRLYNRLFTLTEMQDLQTELNDKYLILGNELVVNGDFSNGLNGWNDNSGGTISIVNEKLVCNSSSGTFIFQSGLLDSSKMYKFTFEVTNYVSGTVYARSSPVNGVQYEQNGVYSDIIQGGNNKSLGGFNFTGTIDNVSVKEILN